MALVVDSAIEFIRPFGVDTFVRNGVVRFYRKPNEIDQRLPKHIIWGQVARALLGLKPAAPPYTDYISSLLARDPAIVRQMLAKVANTTGRPWTTTIAGQLRFSEWTLYGVFVDEAIGAPANSFASDAPLCLAYWNDGPLSGQGAIDFLRGVRPTVAAMIPAKSRTPLAARRAALRGAPSQRWPHAINKGRVTMSYRTREDHRSRRLLASVSLRFVVLKGFRKASAHSTWSSPSNCCDQAIGSSNETP